MRLRGDSWIPAGIIVLILAWGIWMLAGCTATSTKLAIAGSERSDEIRTAVVERQHRSLKILSFRATLAKLNRAATDEERTAILNDAWNDRDLFEFWLVQDTLARALHYATVDAKLAASQSMFDLLIKDICNRAEKPVQAADEYLAAKVGEAAVSAETPTD
jgi:hypothetical protein